MSDEPAVSGDGGSGAMALPEGVSAARLDDEGRIAIDLECVGCGYNLRMCVAEGRCPECGLAVGRSAVGRYLCYHEPKWVQCLAWGMNRFAVALLAVGLTVGMGLVWALIAEQMPINRRPFWPTLLIYGLLPPVAVGFGLLGLARATWPDPSPVGAEGWMSFRRLTRVSFLLGLVLLVFSLAAGAADIVLFNGLGALSAVFGLVLLIAWLAVPVCLLLHARKLAVLIPQPWLARWTLVVMGVIGLAGVVLVVVSNNWFGWYDVAVVWYEKVWPTYTAGGVYSNFGWGWTAGSPYYYHDEFMLMLERVQRWSVWGLGASVLGIVPLFFVYWKAMHKEAAKAKATWASSPWQKVAGQPTERITG